MYKNSSTPSNNTALWHYLGTKHFEFRCENNITPGVLIKKYGIIILKLTPNYIDQIAASLLASATVIKLLSYFCCVMLQPAYNQQNYPINISCRNELVGTDPKLLQLFMIINYKPLPPSQSHSQLRSYIVVLHGQTLFCAGTLLLVV